MASIKKKMGMSLRSVMKTRAPISNAFESFSSTESLLSTEEKIKQLWDSGFSDLSLAFDVITLLPLIKVYQDSALIFDVEKNKSASVEILIEFLMSIITALEKDPYAINNLRIIMEKNINPNDRSPLHEMLSDFLKNISSESPLMNVLKCLSTDILQPAFSEIRDAINRKYSIMKEDGEVKISIVNTSVEVTALRRENSTSQEREKSFYVKWETYLSIDSLLGGKNLKFKMTVTEVEFDENVKAMTKREIREILDPFVDEVAAYRLIWTRQLSRLPVHKDIARLSKSIIIVDSNNRVLYEDEEQKLPGRYSIHELLRILASRLSDKPVLEALESFPEYIRANGDLSEHVNRFFQLPAFSSNGPVTKVLKCINQEMIYPAVQTIRGLLYQKYPYKDMKGGWKIKVILDPRQVCIHHIKKEQSHNESPDRQFNFQWNLKLIFDPKLENIHPHLSILNFDWSPQVNDELKTEVMDLTSNLVDKDSLYRHISSKPLSSIPIYEDLVQLSSEGGFEVSNPKTGQIYYEPSKEENCNQFSEIMRFISSLVIVFEGKKMKDSVQKIVKGFKEDSKTEDLLKLFFSSEIIPESSVVMKVLKCLRYEIISPGQRKFKKAFGQEVPLTKVDGSWRVKIAITDTTISIVHISKEKGRDGYDSTDIFEFKWSTSLFFDKNMSNLKSEVKVIEYYWDQKVKEETKRKLRTMWAPFASWSSQKQELISEVDILSCQDLIKSVCNSLDRQPDVLWPAHLTENLRAIAEALQKVPVPLIVASDPKS